MKKHLSLFLAAALTLVFAACGRPAQINAEGTTAAAPTVPQTAAQAGFGAIPWDQLGRNVGEVRASLGEVVPDAACVWLGAAMCGFREKSGELIYFLFGTQELQWEAVPGYADQLLVAGFCVTPAMLLPAFRDGMAVGDFLQAIGVALDEDAYGTWDDFGEEYSLCFAAGDETFSMSIADYTVHGEGRRALRADDYILVYRDAYREQNEEDLGTKIPWDVIYAQQ